MRKIYIFLAFSVLLFASDEIGVDSLFKKQIGLRSITTLSLLSAGNENSYIISPTLSINGDTTIWDDTKQLTLSQSFIYTINNKLDLLFSASGSYSRQEYTNYINGELLAKNNTNFNSFWLGAIYTFDNIKDILPQIKIQTSIISHESATNEYKNFYLNSQIIELRMRGYNDPVVYSVFAGFGYNSARKFNIGKIEQGNSIYFGGDLSIILNPIITLDLGIEQRFQTAMKINGNKITNIRSIPTISLGSTYAISPDNAIAINADFGGSSAAPDAIFSITFWQKF